MARLALRRTLLAVILMCCYVGPAARETIMRRGMGMHCRADAVPAHLGALPRFAPATYTLSGGVNVDAGHQTWDAGMYGHRASIPIPRVAGTGYGGYVSLPFCLPSTLFAF
ncbi:hypothetical protein B0H19DRAFT_1258950 [Mycena capillaripes]|nr:hypothetical protein B0H19DRAFT_1258950 [Mycena capillaripes]